VSKIVNSSEIVVSTTEKDFLKDYLRSLNGIFNLTDKHLECLLNMIIINKTITGTTQIRKELAKVLQVKGVAAVNNLIKALKDKGAIVEDRNNKCYTYHNSVVPKTLEVKIKFKIAQHV